MCVCVLCNCGDFLCFSFSLFDFSVSYLKNNTVPFSYLIIVTTSVTQSVSMIVGLLTYSSTNTLSFKFTNVYQMLLIIVKISLLIYLTSALSLVYQMSLIILKMSMVPSPNNFEPLSWPIYESTKMNWYRTSKLGPLSLFWWRIFMLPTFRR